jgi:hypothetical protein
MPVNSSVAYETWLRYAYLRDNGHLDYVRKVDKCERFVAGDQWDAVDRAALAAQQRPVLTINKLLTTVANVMGEQINARSEISFRPRSGANPATADVLTKVFRQISDNNQLDWKRSEMFADGIIGSRGFLDIRLGMNDSAMGEVRIDQINRKNVLIDGDADDYDPDNWNEVFTTKWVSADDIEVLYNKEDADLLRRRDTASFEYGYDSIQMNRDRFGQERTSVHHMGDVEHQVSRSIRMVERQFRKLDRQEHFLAPTTGDMRPVPEGFSDAQKRFFVEKYGFRIVPKLVRRIRWRVVADNIVLFDEWSPYKHFTVVPYFPYLRYGNTIGLVENLIGPQELLNKVSSQELHITNTTANSGYITQAGTLVNMTAAELEQKGAQTGLVIEVKGPVGDAIQKITPNQVPSGLDRISFKAEEQIKTISGISDSMQGMDRADVAAKAIQAKKQAGATNLVKPLDNLVRTDFIIARNVIDIVQEFYTEERLMTITHDQVTGESETFTINQPNPVPETGEEESPYEEIINDLTMGEYDVVVTSVPRRETLEDSQFEQAVALRELGIMIPESVLIDSSRLMNKKDIIKQMSEAQSSPEAQAAAQLAQRGQAAAVAKTEAEAASKGADAGLKQAKTQETSVKAQVLANTPIEGPKGPDGNAELEAAQAEHDADMKEREFAHKQRMDMLEASRKQREADDKVQMQQQDMAQKRKDERVAQVQKAAQAAAKPPSAKPHVANRSRQSTVKAK